MEYFYLRNIGKVTLVSDEDFDYVSGLRLTGYEDRSGNFYVATNQNEGLHRLIARRVFGDIPKNKEVDHKDRNGLNNQRDNLRIVTPQQNSMNKSVREDAYYPYKGVIQNHGGTFQARLTVGDKKLSGGNYFTAVEAAEAYDELAYAEYGDIAYLNFPEHYQKG